MSYVVYHHTVSIQERRRSPLSNVAAWIYGRAAGTFMQESLRFLFEGSIFARFAVAITVGVLLGAAIDFSVSFTPVYGAQLTCMVLCAVAAAAAGGFGGVLPGAFWGWLVGSLADTLAAEVVSGWTEQVFVKVAAWFATCVVGWIVGLLFSWLYDRYARRYRRFGRVLTGAMISLTLAAFAVTTFYAARFVGNKYNLWDRIGAWVVVHWVELATIISSVVAAGLVLYLYVGWHGALSLRFKCRFDTTKERWVSVYLDAGVGIQKKAEPITLREYLKSHLAALMFTMVAFITTVIFGWWPVWIAATPSPR